MRVVVSWSSGKDSAFMLWRLLSRDDIEIVGLVTTINEAAGRVAMHAVRRELLERQAAALGLPLDTVLLPHPASNDDYEAAMHRAFDRARAAGADAVAYGDLFLADVRAYRERLMADCGLQALFPLWGEDTARLARDMVEVGLGATITCVDPKQLPAQFAGRAFDATLLADLPAGVDPCGENGEFHTFVHAGPMFPAPLAVSVGDTIERDGFVFTDLHESV